MEGIWLNDILSAKLVCIFFYAIKLFLQIKVIIVFIKNYCMNYRMKIGLFSLFVLLSFSACKKTTMVNKTVNQAFSALYTIQPGDWVQGQNQDGSFFYYTNLSVPELDEVINDHGGVEVYISFDDQSVTAKNYETLPEVVDGVAYGSLHTTGSVTIDLRGADGGGLTSAIAIPITAKIVLIDAQPLD
jgi:hypothetical protein